MVIEIEDRPTIRQIAPKGKSGAGKMSLTDAASKLLRDHIIDLTLAPGERIDEKVLLKKFALSRTPVREALNRLSAEGLVEVRSNHGAYVASMSLKHTMDLLSAYVLCERMVASMSNLGDPDLASDLTQIQNRYERVAERRDLLKITELNSVFHARVAATTGNQFVIQYAADLHNLARRVSFFVYQKEKDQAQDFDFQRQRINSQHHDIIDAVRRHDRNAFIEISTDHAKVFRERLCAIIGDNNDDEIDFASVLESPSRSTS
ncbi:MAG: GntR family transcriptional regulator [Alphaproteobacteria bacterium]|nr:GntR family transcriptional regulator [Alphaproteobacteria bacterium]